MNSSLKLPDDLKSSLCQVRFDFVMNQHNVPNYVSISSILAVTREGREVQQISDKK